jgi:hypothetical protein
MLHCGDAVSAFLSADKRWCTRPWLSCGDTLGLADQGMQPDVQFMDMLLVTTQCEGHARAACYDTASRS